MLELNQEAERLDPFNTRHKRHRFILLDWGAHTQRRNVYYKRQNQSLALEAIDSWLKLNKSAGYAWVSKAELRANLGFFDDETLHAFANASLTEPWEDLTRKKLIRTAVTFWDRWPATFKESAKLLIRNAFHIDTTLQVMPVDIYIFNVSIDNGWEDNLRSLIHDDKVLLRRFEEHVKFRERQRYSN